MASWCTTKCHYQKSGRTFLPPPSLQSRQLLLKDVVYPWMKGIPKELIRFISGLVSTSMRRIVSVGQNLVIVLTSSLGKSEKSIKILFVETVPPLKYPSTGCAVSVVLRRFPTTSEGRGSNRLPRLSVVFFNCNQKSYASLVRARC